MCTGQKYSNELAKTHYSLYKLTFKSVLYQYKSIFISKKIEKQNTDKKRDN